MDFQLEQRDGRLFASGDMTIYHAARMRDELVARWPAGEAEVLLDLESVTELDTCGLQMLLMVQRWAEAQGRSLCVVAPSATVREVLDLCGLQAFCDPQRKAA